MAELLLDYGDQGGLGVVEGPFGYILDVTTHKITHEVAIWASWRPKCEENKVRTFSLQPGFVFPRTSGRC